MFKRLIYLFVQSTTNIIISQFHPHSITHRNRMSIGHNQFVEVYQGKRSDYYAAVSSVSILLQKLLVVISSFATYFLLPILQFFTGIAVLQSSSWG